MYSDELFLNDGLPISERI